MNSELTDELVHFLVLLPVRFEAVLAAEIRPLDAQLDAGGAVEAGLLATVRGNAQASHL